MKYFMFIGIIVFFISCSNKSNSENKLPVLDKINENYNADSQLIVYTLQQFIDREYCQLCGYVSSKTNDKITIYVDSIIYSPDRKKMISYSIIKVPNNEFAQNNEKNINHYFDGEVVAGFREDSQSIWQIYPWEIYKPSKWSNYKQVKNLFQNFFFNEIIEKSDYVTDPVIGFKAEKYGYAVNQPEFWTNSLVWRKGTRLQDLYIFQTEGAVLNPNRRKDIVLKYPDSLLKFYTSAK